MTAIDTNQLNMTRLLSTSTMYHPINPILTLSSDFSGSDNLTSINNDNNANERVKEETEEEEDAEQQIVDFLTEQERSPTDSEWRYRVMIRDLLEDGSVLIAEPELSFDDAASDVSHASSDGSIRIFFGAQAKDIPTGWHAQKPLPTVRLTSTPQKQVHANDQNSHDTSIDLTSPDCSGLVRAPPETSQDSSFPASLDLSSPTGKRGSRTYLVELKSRDSKRAVLDAALKSASPELRRVPSTTETDMTQQKTPEISNMQHTSLSSGIPPPSIRRPLAAMSTSRAQVTARPDIVRREERPHVLPMSAHASPFTSNATVLKLVNVPWTTTCHDLVQWLGYDVQKTLLPLHQQIISVHILCDRTKCRTKSPVFIEVTSTDLARKLVEKKSMQDFQGRKVKITLASRRELLSAIFPTWAQNGFATTVGTMIISNFELEGLVQLCKLKMPFAKATPERPYMNLLSIAAKYPWRSVDLLSGQNEEQAKVLQAIRDGYKLLNQHGKRLDNYQILKCLFITFLEGHGGVSGSLRPIPVTASPNFDTSMPGNTSLPSSASVAHLPARPGSQSTSIRVSSQPNSNATHDLSGPSQMLLDLIMSNDKVNTAREAAIAHFGKTDGRSGVKLDCTPDFIPAGMRDHYAALQAAPQKKTSLFGLFSQQTETSMDGEKSISSILPETPVTTRILMDDYDASGFGVVSQSMDDAAEALLMYSPEVVEKRNSLERLFTPPRVISVRLGRSKSRPSHDIAMTVAEDHESIETQTKPKETAFDLESLARELGTTEEAIKTIVRRLGAFV